MICKSERDLLASLENKTLANAIQASSPELFDRLRNLRKSAQPDPALVLSLFNTINRMAYRSLPYAAYAGVTCGEIQSAATNDIRFHSQDKYLLWTHQPNSQKPNQKVYAKAVVLNPTLRFNQTVAQFIPRTSPEKPIYGYSFVELPISLIKILRENPNELDHHTKVMLLGLDILWPREFTKANAQNKGSLQELKSTQLSSPKSFPGFQIRRELAKPAASPTLSEKSIQTLLKGAEVLFSIYAEPDFQVSGAKNLDSIRDEFQAMHHYQEIPLLEFLDPAHPIGQKFIAKCYENKMQDQSRLSEFVSALLLHYQDRPTDPIQLDFHKIQSVKRMMGIKGDRHPLKPRSFSIVASMVQDQDGQEKFLLRYVKGPQIASHFVRYISTDEKIRNHVDQMVNWERKKHPDVVLAEILHCADREKINQISPQLGFHEAAIPVSILGSLPDVPEIALADLQIYYHEGRFRLRSKKLNKEVLPVLTNLHAIYIDSNPIYQFLSELHVQDSFFEIRWRWGPYSLPYSPRVEMGNLILCPAIWRFGQTMLSILKKQDLDLARKTLRLKGVPQKFLHLDTDMTTHHVDMDNPLSLKSFLDQIRDRDSITLQETFEPTLTTGPEGRYHHDLVIPFGHQQQPVPIRPTYGFSKIAQNPIAQNKKIRTPGSDWTYLKIYFDPIHYSRFLSENLEDLVPDQQTDWFFLPFRDPKFHLRLRIPKAFDPKLLERLDRLCRKKVCTHYSLETYEREIERYGGLRGCQIFEKLSALDSQIGLDLHRQTSFLNLSAEERWIWCALILSLSYLQAFGLSRDELSQLRQHLRKSRSTAHRKRAKKVLATIRSQYLGNPSERPPVLELIRNSLEKTFGRSKRMISRLKKDISQGRVGVDLASFARSFLHICFVRLDFESSSNLEDLVLLDACEILLQKGNDLSKI